MFIHNFKYAMKTMLKNKTAWLWTLIFPLALGTFMYMSFGKMFENDEVFKVIPVAVVEESSNEAFETMLDSLSEEGEDQMLKVEYMTEDKAKTALDNEDVKGIIYVSDDIKLTVTESSYEVTVLKVILDEYKKREKVLTDIAKTNPSALAGAVDDMMAEKTFFTEVITSEGNQSVYTNYFYAVFAMSCLFASFGAIEKIGNIQANVSSLGMRRCLSPNSKAVTVTAEFLSMLVMQFTVEVVSLIYFVILGVDFGNKYPQILLILFCGSCIGIALGVIIGSISKMSEAAKSGICISISMALSVMADLVASGIKDGIEHTMPIINRINPAALIVDSFYALNIYDTYDRYIRNMVTLGGMALALLVISFLVLRRNKYASV
ncbi:MAG: ABC transporter permease [Lachnospira sp.]|nr:ABC transporter permease [Lachnospira sp.]